MKRNNLLVSIIFLLISQNIIAQTHQDSLAIKQTALDYLESQHNANPKQMEGALHPRLVKRTFWTDKATNKDFVDETFAENMIILAERYNAKGDRFPKNPRKEVVFFDISDRTASVKLIADEWIDYMHIVKINGQWKVINVLWQFNDSSKHR